MTRLVFLTIFFDLEKAYDTTCTHGILADLWDLGLGATSPGLFRASCRNVLSGLE